METIVFATNNSHKLEEVRSIVADAGLNIVSLKEIGCSEDIPETAETLEGNALMKARYVRDNYGCNCFADDTGLEVEALGGAPGARSARYAGENNNPAANIAKLLAALKTAPNRKARFRTVVALLLNGKEELFEGVVNGEIINDKRGEQGFGYDSVFVPDGYKETFAQMNAEQKNLISHRGRAVRKLAARLLQTTLITLLFAFTLHAQSLADWTSYRAYYNSTAVEETADRIYVLADNSLYSYGKEDGEVKLYSKQNGLSDTDISLIRYSADAKTLIIIYSNGNIDLWDSDGIKNIPFLKTSMSIRSKTINDIFLYNNYAYLSTDFGVLVLNLTKKEIADTYRLNRVIKCLSIFNGEIIAATTEGLISAPFNANLLDASVWSSKNISGDFAADRIIRMSLFKGKLIIGSNYSSVCYIDEEWNVKTLTGTGFIKSLKTDQEQLLIVIDNTINIFTDLEKNCQVTGNPFEDVASLKADDKYWVAAGVSGLLCLKRNSDDTFETLLQGVTINSPKRNDNYAMTMHNNKLLITGGGRSTNRHDIPGTLITYENGKWWNLDEAVIDTAVSKIIGTTCRDYLGAAVAPDDENHYFVATYGEGVLEIKDGQLLNLFNENNSTLASAITGNQNYVRIGSACFDSKGNLWVTNCRSYTALNVLKPDGQWVGLHYPQINNANRIDKIMITSKGHKWVNVPYEGGIFVLDDGGTVEDTSDDKYNFFSSFLDAQSSTGEYFTSSEYLSMAEDRNGTVWIGSGNGLLKIGNPARAIDYPEQLSITRLVRDDEAYFLSGEAVTAIAVDADNQKWVGTATQGVFLINDDGSQTIYNFTADNSPLLSNSITSIALNNNTGEVFFGTDKGLVSYKSGSVSGRTSMSDVYAFPNPVRPDFNDKVTITGLQNNANVKITDIAGNLICQGRAVGNRFVWNCRSIRGERVATGVYIVFAATADAAESVVTKIAVVK